MDGAEAMAGGQPFGRSVSGLGEPAALPEEVAGLLAPYLGRQRWYAGDGEPHQVQVVESRRLPAAEAEGHSLWWTVVDGDGVRYQLLIGERPGGEPADFLNGHEGAVLGSAGGRYYYDATLDPELSLPLLGLISGEEQRAERVRPISAEQSNTSLVYDDRVIVKVFRRLMDGPNPDVEVTTALAGAGFEQVARPVSSWREGGVDLMFAQEFLVGGSEGWALALTSLRDYYGHDGDDPADAGGDFAGEAARLGRMTARMHLTLAATYGQETDAVGSAGWESLVDDIERRLGRAGVQSAAGGGVESMLRRLRAVPHPGPAIRVHGDYHLGQVMRTDAGWYVLDFEGEPARALEDRLRKSSPMKDVTGMLRSLHYASRFALRERADSEMVRLEGRAEVWEQHNREAFISGYHAEDGVRALLPDDPDVEEAVAAAYELDKALYELDYERAYRPDWVDIPLGALERIVERLTP